MNSSQRNYSVRETEQKNNEGQCPAPRRPTGHHQGHQRAHPRSPRMKGERKGPKSTGKIMAFGSFANPMKNQRTDLRAQQAPRGNPGGPRGHSPQPTQRGHGDARHSQPRGAAGTLATVKLPQDKESGAPPRTAGPQRLTPPSHEKPRRQSVGAARSYNSVSRELCLQQDGPSKTEEKRYAQVKKAETCPSRNTKESPSG